MHACIGRCQVSREVRNLSCIDSELVMRLRSLIMNLAWVEVQLLLPFIAALVQHLNLELLSLHNILLLSCNICLCNLSRRLCNPDWRRSTNLAISLFTLMGLVQLYVLLIGTVRTRHHRSIFTSQRHILRGGHHLGESVEPDSRITRLSAWDVSWDSNSKLFILVDLFSRQILVEKVTKFLWSSRGTMMIFKSWWWLENSCITLVSNSSAQLRQISMVDKVIRARVDHWRGKEGLWLLESIILRILAANTTAWVKQRIS